MFNNATDLYLIRISQNTIKSYCIVENYKIFQNPCFYWLSCQYLFALSFHKGAVLSCDLFQAALKSYGNKGPVACFAP